MKVKTEFIFTEEDLELLKHPIPENPCYVKCSSTDRMACCGCGYEREYAKKIKPYKEAGIFEIAVKISRIDFLKTNIEKEKFEIENIKNSLPDEIKNLSII